MTDRAQPADDLGAPISTSGPLGTDAAGSPTTAISTDLPQLSGRATASVMLIVVGAMLGGAVVSVIGVASSGAGGSYALVGGVVGASVGAWAAVWATLMRRRGWGWRELGFVRPRRGVAHLLWQVPALILLSLVGAALLGGMLGLRPDADGSGGSADIAEALAVGPWLLVVVAACIVLVVPAAEEIVFRRILLDWLLTRMRPGAAVLVSAVAFAVAHVAPAVMVYVVFIGAGAAILRVWYGSLWPALALHAANNGLVVAVAAAALGAPK